MADSLETKIKALDEKIEKGVENLEEQDSTQFNFEKGKLYKENAKKTEALEEFKKVIDKTQSFNLKMDAVFEIMHMSLLDKDLHTLKEYLNLSTKLLKDAGDWEKRNKLKVYEGLYNLLTKNFKDAGKLFLQALMTFTNYELFDYKKFVFYTAITNIITVDRSTLKSQVIDNSDVVACIREIPHLQVFLDSFYNGDYKLFFEEFYNIANIIKEDFYLSKHLNYFIREMAIKVYSQFLRK